MNSVLRVGHANADSYSRHHAALPDQNAEARLTIRVDNFSHILSAYGSAAAEALTASVDLVLDQIRKGGCHVTTRRPGLADISFGQRLPCEVAGIKEAVVAHLAALPVQIGDLRFHIALTCLDETAPSARSAGVSGACDPAGEGAQWVEQYRHDMQIAVEAFEALADGSALLNWQAVVAPDGSERSLYHEGLVRIAARDGRDLSPALVVPALERLGLIRAFDARIVSMVLDELEASPSATLGVNISAKSARTDGWWSGLFERLQASDVARRLVVEITETAAFPPEAAAFVAELRHLGCRVALDDFGMGHASVRAALSLQPDIVKVDAFFLRNANLSDQGRAMFAHLVGIAGAVAPIVIVEGVETPEQSALAEQVQRQLVPGQAACWQQGYHFGHPTFWRSWRHRSAEARAVPLADLVRPSSEFRPWFHAASQGRA